MKHGGMKASRKENKVETDPNMLEVHKKNESERIREHFQSRVLLSETVQTPAFKNASLPCLSLELGRDGGVSTLPLMRLIPPISR